MNINQIMEILGPDLELIDTKQFLIDAGISRRKKEITIERYRLIRDTISSLERMLEEEECKNIAELLNKPKSHVEIEIEKQENIKSVNINKSRIIISFENGFELEIENLEDLGFLVNYKYT